VIILGKLPPFDVVVVVVVVGNDVVVIVLENISIMKVTFL